MAVLDEAANIVPLSALPDLYSHLGSRGIVPGLSTLFEAGGARKILTGTT